MCILYRFVALTLLNLVLVDAFRGTRFFFLSARSESIACTFPAARHSGRYMATGDEEAQEQVKSEKMAKIVELIVKAVDEDRAEELELAGMKITKRSVREVIDSNLQNSEVVQRVLGDMNSEEELEIMQRLREISELSDTSSAGAISVIDNAGSAGSEIMTADMMAELIGDAQGALSSKGTDAGSLIGAALGMEETEVLTEGGEGDTLRYVLRWGEHASDL